MADGNSSGITLPSGVTQWIFAALVAMVMGLGGFSIGNSGAGPVTPIAPTYAAPASATLQAVPDQNALTMIAVQIQGLTSTVTELRDEVRGQYVPRTEFDRQIALLNDRIARAEAKK